MTHEQGALTTTDSDVVSAARPLDQLWVVSCRGLGTLSSGPIAGRLRYWRLSAAGGWTPADQSRFVSSDESNLNTCVFVAGYSYTSEETRQVGLRAYRGLVHGLPASQGIRFIIWSWPSDQGDGGVIRDLRAAAARTDRIAWYFAQWRQETFVDRPVSFIATSFGARIVGGALHLLGGGHLGPFELAPHGRDLLRAQVIFVSPAIDNGWLLPGGRFAMALAQVDRMLLVNNSADRVLKRYHWLYGPRSTAQALGWSGLRLTALTSDVRERIEQVDASNIIGSQHGCGPYFQSSVLLARMRPYLVSPETTGPSLKGLGLPASLSDSRRPLSGEQPSIGRRR